MEEIIDWVKSCGSVAGAFSTVVACIMLFVKPVRKWIVEKIKAIAKSDDMEKIVKDTNDLLKKHVESDEVWKRSMEKKWNDSIETDIVQLRNTINHIYDKNYDSQSLTIRDKESIIDLFAQYKSIGGNHNVEQKYNEMLDWKLRK